MIWNNIKFGISPINWSNDDLHELGADITLDQCLADMQKTGFSGTEMGHNYPIDAIRLKSILGKYNLDLTSGWFSTYFVRSSSPEKELERLDRLLQLLASMGAKTVNLAECSGAVYTARHIGLSHKPVFDDKDWDSLIHGLERAGQLCHTY
ncbi:MAG: myo-inosose-2 dehydratase, partial [Candidatus Marinimicrobia bacterium]|nr:myo-inosose-2 dehydratase [Candidatus Neomarinimicrobiota bacterium]